MSQLRPYQWRALQSVAAAMRRGINRQLIKWPTGTGKTVLFSNLPEHLQMNGRMLVVAHREELIEQAADKLRRWNPHRTVGIEMADRYSNGEHIVVASIQTIGTKTSKRLQKFRPEEFNAVVIDEAHHATATTYRHVLNHFRVHDDRSRLLLGVTATPNRADGQGLGKVFTQVTHDYSMLDAINDGWLVNLRGLAFRTKVSLDQVRILAGELNLGDLGRTLNTAARNDLIVREWLQHAGSRSTVAFCVDIQHALDLAAAFKAYGISAEAVWGDDQHRAEKLKLHRQGQIEVLTNCQVLTEGYDDWRVSAIILARPTMSEGLFTQMVGRGTRIPEGVDNLLEAVKRGESPPKTDCRVMDFVDNTSKHSLITLTSLLGLGEGAIRNGETLTEAATRIKREREVQPAAKLAEKHRLKAQAEVVNLFKVVYAPEVLEFSKFQWIKAGPSTYVLLLQSNEHAVVGADTHGTWYVTGSVRGNQLWFETKDLKKAIAYADGEIRKHGGPSFVSCANRIAPWHDSPANSGLVKLARQIGIYVPNGVTSGELSKKINETLARKRYEKNLRSRNQL